MLEQSYKWLVGQGVKTLPSHGRIMGSIPVRAAFKETDSCLFFRVFLQGSKSHHLVLDAKRSRRSGRKSHRLPGKVKRPKTIPENEKGSKSREKDKLKRKIKKK